MKNILLIILVGLMLTSCIDWLDVRPKDLQYTADYWKTKEDVEAVLASGYSDMRKITKNLFIWSEVRGASVFYTGGGSEDKLQNFQLSSDDNLCKWGDIYRVINMANSVIKYAPEVIKRDETYTRGAMLSHQAEACFMRSLMNFYLIRNWREAPLVIEPYIDDSAPFEIVKSSESVIIEQIKKDIRSVLATGAAKENYPNDRWNASKGRATKWALYALMADVCLWNEDYTECIAYADSLIKANATWRPVFMTNPAQWFEIFDPGNSNESVFEINWSDRQFNQRSNSPYSFISWTFDASYKFTPLMSQRLLSEYIVSRLASVRMEHGAYTPVTIAGETPTFPIYKYQGSSTPGIIRSEQAANYIIYRMADVMLMKAEALVWRNEGDDWQQAMNIVNQIRVRVNLDVLHVDVNAMDELEMLGIVLNERDMELAAEGKRWYDLLRFGKTNNFKYKNEFISIIIENNETVNSSWLRSALKNEWAWFLPINDTELEVNKLLKQNPYYR